MSGSKTVILNTVYEYWEMAGTTVWCICLSTRKYYKTYVYFTILLGVIIDISPQYWGLISGGVDTLSKPGEYSSPRLQLVLFILVLFVVVVFLTNGNASGAKDNYVYAQI